MGRVIIDMSPSLDGYVAGKEASVERPFGDTELHQWLGVGKREPTDVDRAMSARMFETTGAFVIGRRMFDVGIDKWGDDGAFGKPCFVVTHRPAEKLVRGPTTFEFVTDGVSTALALAQEAAGDQDVVIPGGASIAQQCLATGLVNELRLHLVPALVSDGTPLFDPSIPRFNLEASEVVASPNAIHLTLKVLPPVPNNSFKPKPLRGSA